MLCTSTTGTSQVSRGTLRNPSTGRGLYEVGGARTTSGGGVTAWLVQDWRITQQTIKNNRNKIKSVIYNCIVPHKLIGNLHKT